MPIMFGGRVVALFGVSVASHKFGFHHLSLPLLLSLSNSFLVNITMLIANATAAAAAVEARKERIRIYGFRRAQYIAEELAHREAERLERLWLLNCPIFEDFIAGSEIYTDPRNGHGVDYPSYLSNLRAAAPLATEVSLQRILMSGFRYLGNVQGRVTHLFGTQHFLIIAGDYEIWVRTTRRENDPNHVDHNLAGCGFGGDQVWVPVCFAHWCSKRYPTGLDHAVGLSSELIFSHFAEFYDALVRFIDLPRGEHYHITHPAWFGEANVPARVN